MAIDDLYEQDFVEWTQAQADALRAAGRAGGCSNTVEWERVAEELEDVGKSEYRAASSYAAQIIAHLFKLSWTQNEAPQGGWRAEIILFRLNLRRTLTPSLRLRIAQELEDLHRDGAALAAAAFQAHEPAAARDESLRWSLPQILGEADDPLEGR